MSKKGISFVLMVLVAGVIIGDQLVQPPWLYVVWGLGLALPWVVVSRLIQR